MKEIWLKNVLPIAAIYAFRMLGLLMLLPVFTLYATSLKGATPYLIGIAFGAYGLSQGILQIPFGVLSDIFGRKKLIGIGLLLLMAGSILGAYATTINQMIIARTLQGSGAIGSSLVALLADLTPNDIRTKAMAVIGANIGFSFSIAFILSPIIANHFGLSGIFNLTSILAGCGLALLYFVVPNPTTENNKSTKIFFKEIIFNSELLRLNFSIFFQHLIFTATFFVIPLLLKEHSVIGNDSWKFYLPLLALSFLVMLPIISFAEKKRKVKGVLISGIILTFISQLCLSFAGNHWYAFIIFAFLYFVAFNLLEPLIPSIVSRVANPNNKGSAMGFYASFQFLGLFAGGIIAGSVYSFGGIYAIFITNFILSLIWLVISFRFKCNIYTDKLN